MKSETVLQARGLFKSYHKDRIEVPVLRGVDLDVPTGLVTAWSAAAAAERAR